MKKIFLLIKVFLLIFINPVFAGSLKFQCDVIGDKYFQIDVKNSTISDYDGQKVFIIDNEVKWYRVSSLFGFPMVETNNLNINNSVWTRKIANNLKKRSFKRLVKQLVKKNKKIKNYQKKKMVDQELFLVSNYGTASQELEKYLLIEKAISSTSDFKQLDRKCLRF